MTCEDERMSARWKERRARFLGCIENTKLIAERTKLRQENARRERLKKERAEMEKYRRRLDIFETFSFYGITLFQGRRIFREAKLSHSVS